MKYYRLIILVVIIIAMQACGGDELQQYARACVDAIGVAVPDFSCDAGTLVPTTNPTNMADPGSGDCDRPNRLNGRCDPGSRFQVLIDSPEAYVVAHCRKKIKPANDDGLYGDIAVIQHSRKNGATCFYQSRVYPDSGTERTSGEGLPAQVKAPSRGQSEWPWLSPATSARGIRCVVCHDNGPLIRSPYITQNMGINTIPGAQNRSFNGFEPYYFVGKEFASWAAYQVVVQGNECNKCHRMGVSNQVDVDKCKVNPNECAGTSLTFGLLATGKDSTELHKNPHSQASPIWMPPFWEPPYNTSTDKYKYNSTYEAAAQAIQACALRLTENPLPNSPACTITQFAGCSCSGDMYNCSDFSGFSNPDGAQACFKYCIQQGARDIHRLDQDNDGIACE